MIHDLGGFSTPAQEPAPPGGEPTELARCRSCGRFIRPAVGAWVDEHGFFTCSTTRQHWPDPDADIAPREGE